MDKGRPGDCGNLFQRRVEILGASVYFYFCFFFFCGCPSFVGGSITVKKQEKLMAPSGS